MELYILESLSNETYYVGISKNSSIRLSEHNKGKCCSTKRGRPWKIIYVENHNDYKSAREREKFLKSYKGVGEKRGIIKNSKL